MTTTLDLDELRQSIVAHLAKVEECLPLIRRVHPEAASPAVVANLQRLLTAFAAVETKTIRHLWRLLTDEEL